MHGKALRILLRSSRCGRALAAKGRTARADIGCGPGEDALNLKRLRQPVFCAIARAMSRTADVLP